MEFIKKMFIKYKKYISYIFFGVLTTAVYFATYYTCRYLKLDVLPSTCIAWFCSVLFAFVTNKLFVFESKTKTAGAFFGEMVKFYASRLFSLGVDMLITWFFVDILNWKTGVKELIAKIVANVVVLILNFVLSQFLVFTKGKEKAESEENEKL